MYVQRAGVSFYDKILNYVVVVMLIQKYIKYIVQAQNVPVIKFPDRRVSAM